jgi:type 2 lantibiotic biosynthesis protein LanM
MESFLRLAAPIIQNGRIRLQQDIHELAKSEATVPFDPENVIETMMTLLPHWLLTIISRTLVLEMHVARLQGELVGETPEARFQSFTDQLEQPDTAVSILNEYPVMARQIITCVEQWADFSLSFLQHLCRDWPQLLTTFQPNMEPGQLITLDNSGGDRHRNGRSVLIAHFSSGFRLVYKPTALAVDLHFQQLLGWLNEQGTSPPFRLKKVVDGGSYGWVEFIQASPCQSVAQIERFYQRQGGLLAILYLLQATDFHCENLIAAGEHPVLLDLEALFHPHLDHEADAKAIFSSKQMISQSVLRVGLLPERVAASGNQSEGIDDSALSGGNGQLTPYPMPVWLNIGSDTMRLTRQPIPTQAADNLTSLNGTAVSPVDFVEEFVSGFVNIYQLLQKKQTVLLAKNGPLMRFAQDTVRVIIRPTATYMTLLYESFHPDLLRDTLKRDQHFDYLWRNAKSQPNLAAIIPSEQADLAQGDIPLFSTKPHSSQLWDSRGKVIPNFYVEPSLAQVQHRLRQFSEADCQKQSWFIRASIATLVSGDDPKHYATYHLSKSTGQPSSKQFLSAARRVGDRLLALALRGEDDAIWIGLTSANGRHWALAPQQLDFYDGLPGTIFFLAYLGKLTQEQKYTTLAKAASKNLSDQIAFTQAEHTSVGAFNGWGGILYLLSHLSSLWQQPQLLQEAERILRWLPPLIAEDEDLDIVGGAAGCLAGLLSYYHCQPSSTVLSLAQQCGVRLLATAKQMAVGIGWPFEDTGLMPLCGFSHGAAGIAAMLQQLTAVTNDPRFAAAAQQAIAYEQSLFSAKQRNWPDFRGCQTEEDAQNWSEFMTTWCHGAPGIGLGRLLIWPYNQNGRLRQEINIAVDTTIAQGFGFNHCLCHGDLGNLELLTLAAATFDNASWRQERDVLASAVLNSIEQDGWQCGAPLGVESPGLMTGIAGVGYGLLRLAFPNETPSVLTLEPPKSA